MLKTPSSQVGDSNCCRNMTVSNEQWDDDNSMSEDAAAQDFSEGDHVYKWCNFGGVSKAYTHHGMVVSVEESPDDDVDRILTILDFNHLSNTSSSVSAGKCSSGGFGSCHPTSNDSSSSFGAPPKEANEKTVFRILRESSKDWHKVLYFNRSDHPVLETARPGTCTAEKRDALELVMDRIEFVRRIAVFRAGNDGTLISHAPAPFPSYNVLTANCECFAVWISTGTWCSLQGLASARSLTGKVAGASVAAATTTAVTVAVTTTEVTTAAAGVWGWLGYTTTTTVTTSLAAACPWLIPLTLVASAGLGYGSSKLCDKSLSSQFSATTKLLSDAFDDEDLLNNAFPAEELSSLANGP